MVVSWAPFLLPDVFVCVYSNSHNDVPRVAQQYGNIAAHTRRRASILVVFVLLRAHAQFCWFDKADTTTSSKEKGNDHQNDKDRKLIT